MSSIIQSLVTNATDPKIAFAAATLFGYCLYKLMVMTNKPNVQQLEGSDKIDNNIIYTDRYDNYKLVLVIRTDLKMGKGKVAAQCAHAAVTAYKSVMKHPKILRAWEESGQPKITVKVDSEAALQKIAKQAKTMGLLSNIVLDAGHTQVDPGTKTVCGIGPGPSKLVDKITGHLKLF